MKPPHAVAEDRFPIEIARLQKCRRFVRTVVKNHRWPYAVAAVAVNRRDVWSRHTVVIEPFIKWFDSNRLDASRDQVADRVLDHRGDNAGVQTKAVCEIGGDVIFAAAHVDLALMCFAKRNDAW